MPRSRLALVILLDQFTRSIYRGKAGAFDGDAAALRLARVAFDGGRDALLSFEERHFLATPFLYAVTVDDARRAELELARNVELSPSWGRFLGEAGVEQARRHAGVLERFGRFTRRNEAPGRPSTPDEVEFFADWGEYAGPTHTSLKSLAG